MEKDIFLKHWDRSNNLSAKWDELEMRFGEKNATAMWIADMDFPTVPAVVDVLVERAKQGIFGYTVRPDSYFQAVSDWTEKRFHYNMNPENFLHTPGGVASFTLALETITKEGDAVILTPPAYPGFFKTVEGTGRKLITSPMKEVSLGEYTIDWEDFEEKIKTHKVKAFIFCNPHNPIGKVYKREDLEKIAALCKKYDMRVIEDQMWRDLTFAPAKTMSLLELGPEMENYVIACVSATKTFNLAGLHASFVYVPKKEEREKIKFRLEVLDIHRNNCFSILAMETAFREGEEWLETALHYLEENIDICLAFIHERLPKLRAYKPESTYTLWIDFAAYGLGGAELTEHLTKHGNLACGNGASYGEGGETSQRINIACSRQQLQDFLEGLETALAALGE